MIVNLPEEAAATICFSIDSLILLDSCYTSATIHLFARHGRHTASQADVIVGDIPFYATAL
jgi:hypothetical protein